MNGYKRKKDGKMIKKKLKDSKPRFTETLQALFALESNASKNLKDFGLKTS